MTELWFFKNRFQNIQFPYQQDFDETCTIRCSTRLNSIDIIMKTQWHWTKICALNKRKNYERMEISPIVRSSVLPLIHSQTHKFILIDRDKRDDKWLPSNNYGTNVFDIRQHEMIWINCFLRQYNWFSDLLVFPNEMINYEFTIVSHLGKSDMENLARLQHAWTHTQILI